MGKTTSKSLPLSLRVVAFVMIAIGTVACFNTWVSMARGGLVFSVHVIALGLGIGLVCLQGWARVGALLYAGFICLIAVAGIVDTLFDLGLMRVTYGGQPTSARAIAAPVLTICLLAGGVMVFSIHVLLRSNISLLFRDRVDVHSLDHVDPSDAKAIADDSLDSNRDKT